MMTQLIYVSFIPHLYEGKGEDKKENSEYFSFKNTENQYNNECLVWCQNNEYIAQIKSVIMRFSVMKGDFFSLYCVLII